LDRDPKVATGKGIHSKQLHLQESQQTSDRLSIQLERYNNSNQAAINQ
jgi:hypothetical protein